MSSEDDLLRCLLPSESLQSECTFGLLQAFTVSKAALQILKLNRMMRHAPVATGHI